MASKTSERFFERIKGPPIPPVEENMERFSAGAVTIGVEFRLLTDEIVGEHGRIEEARANGYENLNDNGVSLHVFVKAADGDLERLRFDCFESDPHYHYLSWENNTQDIIHVDRTMTGDVVAWVLDRIRTRLPQLLQRAGMENAARIVDTAAIERILPQVTEAAYRALRIADRDRTRDSAVAMARRLRA